MEEKQSADVVNERRLKQIKRVGDEQRRRGRERLQKSAGNDFGGIQPRAKRPASQKGRLGGVAERRAAAARPSTLLTRIYNRVSTALGRRSPLGDSSEIAETRALGAAPSAAKLISRSLPSAATCEPIMNQGDTIKLFWIPSHCNIDGNDWADSAAKSGLSKSAIDFRGVWFTDRLPSLKKDSMELMTHYYLNYSKGCKYVSMNRRFGCPSWFSNSTFSRSQICLINLLLIRRVPHLRRHVFFCFLHWAL